MPNTTQRNINRGDTTVSWSSVKSMAILSNFGTKNRAMLKCLQLALEACGSAASVLVTGENGTGKSLLAKSIHYSSSKSERPCEILSCARLDPNAIEAELFGISYDKAETIVKKGALERAAGGTLIIDEIELLSIHVQTVLLRAMETGTFRLVGGGQSRQVDTRFIATSDGNLSEKAAHGLFLEDLIYSLGEVTLRLPPLRERREDIPSLVDRSVRVANQRYGKKVAGISKTAMEFLKNHDFPDNIRELNHLVSRAVKAASRDTIFIEDLGVVLGSPDADAHFRPDAALLPLAEMEKRHIAVALSRTHGNVKAAAHILHVPLATLRRKIQTHGLEAGPAE